MWVLFIRCFDSKFKQEFVFDRRVLSDSEINKCDASLGSVQEPENVISSIMAENCSVFGVKITIYGSESLGFH